MPFKRKPSGVLRLNRAHPLARGLVDAWFMSEGAGPVRAQIVPRSRGLLEGDARWAATPHGHALRISANDGSLANCGAVTHGVGTGDFTWVAIVKSNNAGEWPLIAGVDGFAPAMYWRINPSISQNWGVYWDPDTLTTGNTLTEGRFYQLVMRRSGTTLAFWQDGIQTPSSYTKTTSMANGVLRFGYDTTSTNVLNGDFLSFLFYKRALSQNEIRALYDDPWQIVLRVGRALSSQSTAADTPLVAAQGSFVLSGQAAAFPEALVSAQGAYSFTGQAAALNSGLSFVAAQGAYTYNGQVALFKGAVASSQGSYVLTGQAAAFTYAVGSLYPIFMYWGAAAPGTAVPALTAAQGTYALTGQAAVFAWKLVSAQGAYAYAGQVALLDKALPSAQGSYALAGQTTILANALTSARGIYDTNGQPAALLTSLNLVSDVGTFVLSGQTDILALLSVSAQGSYAFTGRDVALTLTGMPTTLVAVPGNYIVTGAGDNVFDSRLNLNE